MVMVHSLLSSALKSQFSASKAIEDLSSHFVMVNVEDSEEPKDEQYFPDGGYVPRILFVGKQVNTEYSLTIMLCYDQLSYPGFSLP
jgi:protein-disulfide reductase (glutathione)